MNGALPLWLLWLAVLALVLPPMPTGHPLESDGDALIAGCNWSARLRGRKYDENSVRVCDTDAIIVTGVSGTGTVSATCSYASGSAAPVVSGNVSPIACDTNAVPYVQY